MNKKLKFEYLWFEWAIKFKCKCGEMIEMTDNDENPIECEKCGKRFSFVVSKDKLKEIKI